MSTLLWIEHDGESLNPSTYQLVQAVQQLPRPIIAMVIGHQVEKIANQVAKIKGIDRVIYAMAPYYFPFRAEPIAKIIAHYAKDSDALFAASSTTSKNIFPRVAALLDRDMLTEVIQQVGEKTFLHPIYAGNAIAQEEFKVSKMIATVRATAFEKAVLNDNTCEIQHIDALPDDTRSKVTKQAKRDNSKPDLQSAKIVVSGGRGFGTAEQFLLAEQFANSIGAALGATRAAVDAGFASNEIQVGQTGKVVAPEVYFAIGISGAIQHMAGMKDSKNIIAINKDPDAPIFDIATYGLVADLFEVIPKIMKELS
ncbi:MAG: electron transfer flavoprotein subunit alpha/FixB family protein [Gammaproteobacteria bacterium]|nr:electron transfer flavoprotein subunit alpha/FixB family protein [Gammaproteobacteria bacterium]